VLETWNFQRLLALVRGSCGKIFRALSHVWTKIQARQGQKIAFFPSKISLWNFVEHMNFFFHLKEHQKLQVLWGPVFLKCPSIYKKGQCLKQLLENTKKVGIFSNISLFSTKSEAKFKKKKLHSTCSFWRSFKQKKILDFI